MLANLFERFCVEVDTSFDKFDNLLEKYNLLSIDFGDGDNAACQIIWNPFDSKFEVKLLTFKKGVERYHTTNILYQSNEQIELLSVDRLTSAAHIQEKTYSNFKTICDTFHEKEHYQGDNASPTYEELMSHSFACIVKCLFENNASLDPKRKTIIMVGRPSSTLWSECEQEYVKVLRHNIPNTQEILLVTIPESIAAMAGEIGMNQDSWENGTKQIIDAGSSTFDLTTVSPQGTIPEGQDSFQFGGNQLDELLVHFGDDCLQEDNENRVLRRFEAPEMGKKAKLRIKKELVYGEHGSNLNSGSEAYLYRLTDENGRELTKYRGQPETFSFVISKEVMDIVLKNPDELDCLRTDLCHQGGGFEDKKEPQVSWLSGCETVLRRFHNETKGLCKDGKPDVLILTGGVSNMPEVCSLAEKIFQPRKIIISSSPSTSVAKGLALVLANEIKKKWLLDKLYQTLDKKFPDVTNLREAAVEETCAVSLDCYEKTIQAWANENENKTLRQCVDALTSPNNQFFDCNAFSISDLAEKWYSKNRIANKVMNPCSDSSATAILNSKEYIYECILEPTSYKLPKDKFFFLEEVSAIPDVTLARMIRAFLVRDSTYRNAKLILTGSTNCIPKNLADYVQLVELGVPTFDDLCEDLKQRLIRKNEKKQCPFSEEQLKVYARRMCGLTSIQIDSLYTSVRNTSLKYAIESGNFDQKIWREKETENKKTGLIAIWIKIWKRRCKMAFCPEFLTRWQAMAEKTTAHPL